MKAYTFDVNIAAHFTIEAASQLEAEKLLQAALWDATVSAGQTIDGQPLVANGCTIDEGIELIEIDGEAV